MTRLNGAFVGYGPISRLSLGTIVREVLARYLVGWRRRAAELSGALR